MRGADGVEVLGAIAPGPTLLLWWGTGQEPQGAHLGGEELSPQAYGGAVLSVEGLRTADLVDAIGRLHRHRCHLLDLVSPTPGRVLFGPAVTISYFPSCLAGLDPDTYNLANLFYEAVGEEPEGKVVVLASNGYPEVSMGGGPSSRDSRNTAARVC